MCIFIAINCHPNRQRRCYCRRGNRNKLRLECGYSSDNCRRDSRSIACSLRCGPSEKIFVGQLKAVLLF